MARMTKREAEEFRQKIKSILAEPHHWRSYEDQRDWLRKLLLREENYYTAAEQKAVDRIAFARTPFKGWAGFSISELAKRALRYSADIGESEEQLLKEAKHASQLAIDDMGALVGLCIFAGMDIPRFNPGPNPYRYDDD
jgi:hypothetical protein